MDTVQPAYRARVACDEERPGTPLPTLLARRGSLRPTAVAATGEGVVAEISGAGAHQGEAPGDAGGDHTSPFGGSEAAPVPIEGHRLSFTRTLKGWLTRSPLSPKTPRQSPRTSPRTPRSDPSTTPRPRWSTSSHENPFFPPSSSQVSHPSNVTSDFRPQPGRPVRPRSTSAPTGDLPTLQKKRFLARMRLKFGHSGESSPSPSTLSTATNSAIPERPVDPLRQPTLPPFRRAASGPAKLLDRDHREQRRRSVRVAVEVQQEEASDRVPTPLNGFHPLSSEAGRCITAATAWPSASDNSAEDSFQASGHNLPSVSSFTRSNHSHDSIDSLRSLTKSTSSSPTPRPVTSGSSAIDCFHPFLGAPVYNGPLRVQTRPSSMRQRAYGASWTGLSIALTPSAQTVDAPSSASTSSANDRADSDAWPPPGLVSRFSSWTPTEPERRSSYHSSVFVSLIARHDLALSSISLHQGYWPPDPSPTLSNHLGAVSHVAASNSAFHPLLTQTSRRRILSLRKKRSAAALVDWPSLEVAAPTAIRPSYPSITSSSRLPRWPYSLSDRSSSRNTAEPSIVCAREDEAWLRESRPASKKLRMGRRMVSVGVQTE